MIRFSQAISKRLSNKIVKAIKSEKLRITTEFSDKILEEYKLPLTVLTKETVILLMDNLITYLNDKHFEWTITDYHWGLLFTILDNATWYNFEIDIDFDRVIDCHFWDTDFLMQSNVYNNLTMEQKKSMGINSEVFSITNKLKAHSEELLCPKELVC